MKNGSALADAKVAALTQQKWAVLNDEPLKLPDINKSMETNMGLRQEVGNVAQSDRTIQMGRTRRSAESGYEQDTHTDLEKTTNQVAPPTDIYNRTILANDVVIADESIQNLRA